MPLNSDNIFIETQKYDDPRLKYFAIALTALAIITFLYFITAPLHTVSNVIGFEAFFGLCVMLIVDMYVFFKSLFIKIDEHGISLKEKPSKTEILCHWENIDQIIFRYYKYGIWGVKSSRKQGMAYNLKGKVGIQIIFKNGQKLQLGIQNMEEAKLTIEHYFKPENSYS
ncbi:hypothetical protein [Mucilaginibacter lappiensis]|uniref:PH domain-containing protein n=1 Tax=Mucilaginibacter lappiensis TaxID=354630 RepID=A0A1N7FF60_9SPHI|nr:hypothetical protein [Mucilaginibacter lappiensis]MBB6112199.1 hypothetical protein [Mucilaginibacter lappiensis]MBB6129026.1 hypothetical protein [Mucilaginibacter lappiensis]SIR98943.1 hypothetical protein SAMN05421821_117146 [Mucilaginibacter lappiensis]